MKIIRLVLIYLTILLWALLGVVAKENNSYISLIASITGGTIVFLYDVSIYPYTNKKSSFYNFFRTKILILTFIMFVIYIIGLM